MNITLQPIGDHNREACLALRVSGGQRTLIGTNERSLSQASQNAALVPTGIYVDDTLVGFLMYDPRANGVMIVHRIMIDQHFQRRGIGRRAMQIAMEQFHRDEFETVYLSFRPVNHAARALYDELGFVEHEIEADGEVVYRHGPPREILPATVVLVRKATAADESEIALVNASAIAKLRETYRPTQKAIANKKAIGPTLTRLVAVVNGRVVGAVDYKREGERIHFLALDVHADFRRQGVARRLMSALDEIGKREGATRLSTYTITQTGNCKIFSRLGFRIVSEEPADFYESDRFDSLTEAYLERAIQ